VARHGATSMGAFSVWLSLALELDSQLNTLTGSSPSGFQADILTPMLGRTISHYQIVEKLGEGGMGVVYKARDTRLNRFVAIKVLPPDKGAHERRRRFAQEAQAASALNHPNIITIYDIVEENGTDFIIMEYVQGKTLDQVIGRKGLRTNEALKYAIQIADALAKAHSAGIIHRDLKPSNVMVSSDGHVKVLDFGLAKLTEHGTDGLGDTATLRPEEPPDTAEGTIVGTAAYMSPEQAEARPLDGRSDIFSFGSVLYEMVIGQRAFKRESMLSTLSAILKEEPKPVSALAEGVPRDLEKIITRCLRKDPDRRFQHMADLKVALSELKEESESGTLTAAGGIPARGRNRSLWALTGLVILLGAGAWVWYTFMGPALHQSPQPKLVSLTTYPGSQFAPALSPDGKQVAFSWDGEQGGNFNIYMKLVATGDPVPLTTSLANEGSPAWSPDGQYIAFYRETARGMAIMMIPALRGAERKLGESNAEDLFIGRRVELGLSWSPDGKYLAIVDRASQQDTNGIFILSVETGEKRPLTPLTKGHTADIQPSYSPDGKALAFVATFTEGALYVLPITTTGIPTQQPRRLTDDNYSVTGLGWTADSRHIAFSSFTPSGGGLFLISPAGGTVSRISVSAESPTMLSIAGTRLAYVRSAFEENIWRIPGPNATDRTGAPVRWIASTQGNFEQQFSPDGSRIAFVSGRSGWIEVFVCDGDGRNAHQLTFLGANTGSPHWSPDGRWIAFDSPKYGSVDIFVVSAEGGQPRRLTTESSDEFRPSWSADGRWIYFSSNWSGRLQIWKAPADGGAAVQVTRGPRGGEEAFESEDGKYVYFSTTDEPGIWSVPSQGGKEIKILNLAQQGLWALTRQGICFFDLKSEAGPAINYYEFAAKRLRVIHQFSKQTRIHEMKLSTPIAVHPDGKWILYSQIDQASSNLMLVENFR
jgi:eukaryotic-like serine/threonine-protein kinase